MARSLEELLGEGMTRSGFEKSFESSGQLLRRELHTDNEGPGREVSRLQRLTRVMRRKSRGQVGRASDVVPRRVFAAADNVDDASIGHEERSGTRDATSSAASFRR